MQDLVPLPAVVPVGVSEAEVALEAIVVPELCWITTQFPNPAVVLKDWMHVRTSELQSGVEILTARHRFPLLPPVHLTPEGKEAVIFSEVADGGA